MNVQPRIFLLSVALTTVAAMPAFGQPSPSAITPNDRGTSGGASIPDFSGSWNHTSLNGLELPSSGPGPVRNRSRLRTGPQAGVGNGAQLVGDYDNSILRPWAAQVVKKFGEISLAGLGYPTPRNQCWPEQVPFVFANFGMQLLQQPDKITILYPFDHQFRQVRMNEPHPAPVTPSWYGDSVGHYEGDTLVIDTVGIKVGPHRMVDRFGTPYTPALHVVERYRLLDYEATKEAMIRAEKEWPRAGGTVDPNYRGKGLQLEFTVEDEGVFTMPWSATITYGRDENTDWDERVCAENVQHDYEARFYSDKDAHLPTADKPDF